MKAILFVILNLIYASVFSQKIEFSDMEKKNTQVEISNKKISSNFSIYLEGNSDLNLCFGDLGGRIAWISPGISGGTPYNSLEEINTAIENGLITQDTPYVDPNSTGNYYLGPFIYLDNNNCDGEYDGSETLMENINELPAGCYIVYVIDALGNQSEITTITISETPEIMTLIPLITNECNEDGSIEIQIIGGSPFNIGENYIYSWSSPNNFTANTQSIYQLTAGSYTLTVKDANECLKTFDFIVGSSNCGISQTIDLEQGWSIISTYIDPNNNNIEFIFSSVIDNLEIIKDEHGNVYWPIFGLNTIGSLMIGEGYHVKMSYFDQISVEGSLVPYNTPIIFHEGWNLIGYLHPEPSNTIQMMNSIALNNGPMEILKNSTGNVYWPEFGLNSIGDMMPGEGYQIKLDNLIEFSYPLISARYGNTTEKSTLYFEKPIKTDQNMVIGIPVNSWEINVNIGDEIGAFDDNDNLIGSSVYNNNNLALTIWGDDLLSENKDGAKEGELIKLKLWNSYQNKEKELIIVLEKGNLKYAKDAISIAKNISFSKNHESRKLISTHDLLGRHTKPNIKNQVIFQIYDDGIVKKKYFFN